MFDAPQPTPAVPWYIHPVEAPLAWQRLADGGLLTNAVHEITRMVSPVIYMRRTATRDTELMGQQIREGDKLAIDFEKAGRKNVVARFVTAADEVPF